MTKSKLPLIIAAVVVVGLVGAYLSGAIGSRGAEGPTKKYVVPPVPLAENFTINTADPNGSSFLVANVAVTLAPMDKAAWDNFSGANAGGHGGGSGEMPGAVKVASYPKFRDAVIDTASTFTAKELRSKPGKARFKNELLERFAQIAEIDEAAHKAAPEDAAVPGLEPPYRVEAIDFMQWAVQ